MAAVRGRRGREKEKERTAEDERARDDPNGRLGGKVDVECVDDVLEQLRDLHVQHLRRLVSTHTPCQPPSPQRERTLPATRSPTPRTMRLLVLQSFAGQTCGTSWRMIAQSRRRCSFGVSASSARASGSGVGLPASAAGGGAAGFAGGASGVGARCRKTRRAVVCGRRSALSADGLRQVGAACIRGPVVMKKERHAPRRATDANIPGRRRRTRRTSGAQPYPGPQSVIPNADAAIADFGRPPRYKSTTSRNN
jgi:hypothetical protein